MLSVFDYLSVVGLKQHLTQFLATILHVLRLCTMFLTVQNQFPGDIDAASKSGNRAVTPPLGQNGVIANFPPKRYLRVHFVHVLPAWATAASKLCVQLGSRYRQAMADIKVFHGDRSK